MKNFWTFLGQMMTPPLLLGVCACSLVADPPAGIGRTTAEILPNLDKGLTLVEEQHQLPESSWFRKDKRSKQEEINNLLDQALDVLQIEAVKNYREEIRTAERNIRRSQERISKFRQQRLTAPESRSFGLDVIPFMTTRKGLDERIKEEQSSIKRERERIAEIRSAFLQHLRSIGLDISDDDFNLLLNTVNGDQFLDLKLVFDQVRALTVQLEKLTEESDENVAQARRYFGMYSILLRVLDRAQLKFMEDIENVHLPKLNEFRKAAQDNIREAEDAIERGGDVMILRKNIESNNLTIKALSLYEQYLIEQKSNIQRLNEMLSRDMLTADNTYRTVSLATQVVDMLRTGIRNYELLLRLEPPNLRAFENKELQSEIRKLTELMRE